MLEAGPCYIAFRDSEMCIGAEYPLRSTKKSRLRAVAGVREVCTTKAGSRATPTKIRRNFNISRRRERAECNPLDKRVPPPWCLLTNRGHRFRAELRKTRMGDVDEEEASIAEELERIVSLCYVREGTGARRTYSSQERQREEKENDGVAGSSPRSFIVLCRQNKLLGFVAQNERHFRSLVFAIIAVTVHRGQIVPGRDRPVQLLFFAVVTVAS